MSNPKGYWVYEVYSFNPKNNSKNPIEYYADHNKAYVAASNYDKELRQVGRHAGVKGIWVNI